MSRNDKVVLYEGWLTKSPPTKRIWRARWRKRWFSLQPGELPGQYLLTYYTDRNCRKMKGVIDLDHCEQVDTGLKYEVKKLKFDYMFDIKTPTRTYYLAADNENEMKAWVKCICDILGLEATEEKQSEDMTINSLNLGDVYFKEIKPDDDTKGNEVIKSNSDSPPVSTGAYIPISECITGRSPTQGVKDFYSLLRHNIGNSYYRPEYSKNHTNVTYDSSATYLNDVIIHNNGNDPRFYDFPRQLQAPKNSQTVLKNSENYYNLRVEKYSNISPLQSPTDSESVFTDDDWSHNTMSSNNSIPKVTHRSDNSVNESIQKCNKLSLDNNSNTSLPPPRPPKSSHVVPPSTTYFNLPGTNLLPLTKTKEQIEKSKSNADKNNSDDQNHINSNSHVINDDMYDFPRSHQIELGEDSLPNSLSRRHCYNNAAPVALEGNIFRYDISPKPSTSISQIFHYDPEDIQNQNEPASPTSQSSSSTVALYSNLPSPLLSDSQLIPPPKINRSLKPIRKLSDAQSICSTTEPSSPHHLAPSVDRTLKPVVISQNTVLRKMFDGDTERTKKIRAAPSPTPPDLAKIHDSVFSNSEDMYHSFYYDVRSKGDLSTLQYLDLDHNTTSTCTEKGDKNLKNQPLRSPGASTVYKKVDFMKTEAFNITRQHLEKERGETTVAFKK